MSIYWVALLVASACLFALGEAWRLRRRMTRLARLPERTSGVLSDAGELSRLVEQLRDEVDPRAARGAYNQLILELNAALYLPHGVKMYWRVCVAAALAGAIVTLPVAPIASAGVAATGLVAAALCARWVADARRERGRAVVRWRRLAERSRSASFEPEFQSR